MTLFESLSYPAVPRVRPISGLLSYMSQCIPVLCLNQVDFFFSVTYNCIIPVFYSMPSQGDMCMILSPEISYLKHVLNRCQNQKCCKNAFLLIQTERKSSILVEPDNEEKI